MMDNPQSNVLFVLTEPGWIGVLVVCGFDAERSRCAMVVWPIANFVAYFVVGRCLIGILKIMKK
jgi:hypothetical protein